MTRLGHFLSGLGAARKWVATLSLLAFFLQSLAVQTHIHQSIPLKAVSQHLPGSQPFKGQDPVDQCRLCQELVHAGQFVTPSVALAIAGPAFALAIYAQSAGWPDSFATAFAWRSRAPPRH
jgi:hypothetical protein